LSQVVAAVEATTPVMAPRITQVSAVDLLVEMDTPQVGIFPLLTTAKEVPNQLAVQVALPMEGHLQEAWDKVVPVPIASSEARAEVVVIMAEVLQVAEWQAEVGPDTLEGSLNSMPDPNSGTVTGRTGNGFARITYTLGNSTISLAAAGGVTRVAKGELVTLTATIDYAGKITFFADGKKIPGCISLQSSVGSRTCNWRPAVQKSVTLTARLVPIGAGASVSTPLYVSVAKRSSVR
jgi:hypothetical protein